jgi:threonine synthase
MMKKITNLKCVKCGREYGLGEIDYTCTGCGIEGILDVRFDYDAVRKELTHETLQKDTDYSMWRYLPAIPLEGKRGIQPLQVGWTPLYETDKFQKETGLKSIYIKDDSKNPTASLKDRASAVGVAKAVELGRSAMCAASTGNAASSLSGFAASAGIETFIFVPKAAPEAKVTQLLIYGSQVFLVDGTYDEAVELCFEAAAEYGWYNRSCAINPYLVEGKKTVAYEMCEQMNWDVPDIAVVAVGDGCSIAGVWKGFSECRKLGLTDKLPKVVGVQAGKADPVTRAFNNKTYEFEYKRPETIADSISVGIPRNGIKALNAVNESGGYMIDVSDEEILRAMKLLAQRAGIFGEPSGAAGFAGILKMHEMDLLSGNERVACIVTGSGLKDIKSAALAAGRPHLIVPKLSEIKSIISK